MNRARRATSVAVRDVERIVCNRVAGEAVGCKITATSIASCVARLTCLGCVGIIVGWTCGETAVI